ncbi:PilZ domain-containing protein [Aureimonas ureilytica]|uniref:PilZ domain-containing protein n=1 Tax=Aureimonas ureilytica TaxID=401562 RepID=UPI003CE8EAED
MQAETPPNRRRENRRKTRLRPGKLVTEGGEFLCDCTVIERSESGARIRAFAPVTTLLPEDLFLFEEIEAFKHRARIVWANGAELGLVFLAPGFAVDDQERNRIAGRFYAVSD